MEFLIIGIFLLAIYFIPTFIAFHRRHTYKWVNPIAGNVTGKGSRNSGDTIGSLEYGRERGYGEEKNN